MTQLNIASSHPLRKFWELLESKQRTSLLILIGMMFVGMILETFGIGLVIPVLGNVMNADLVEKYPAAEAAFIFLGYPDRSQMVISTVLVLVGAYLIKVLFLGVLAWYQTKFVFGLQARLSVRLFSHYLHQPFAFHLRRNSAHLIRNTTTEVTNLSASANCIIAILAEFMVIVGIAILLLVVEPVGTLLVTAILSVVSSGYYVFTRTKILKWGQARQLHEGMRIQHLQQGLGGVKEIKLSRREEAFIQRYEVHNQGSAVSNQRYGFMQQIPRLWLEFLAVMLLAILVFVLIRDGKTLETMVPVIGVFGAAAFRLMPSANRIIGSLHAVRFAVPTITILHNEFATRLAPMDASSTKEMHLHNELCLDNVGYRYPEGHADVLRGISLSVGPGKTVGFIGGSGAGKSTLVDVILGIFSPKSGAVLVDGVSVSENLKAWWSQVGYVPQTIFLVDDMLWRNVAFGLSDEEVDFKKVKKAIEAAQLGGFIASLPEGLETMVGERGVRLSGGQRQRIGIARALYHEPTVLVLDEATSSLDTETEKEVMKAVDALHGQKTILIVAHRLSTVVHCDWIYRIEGGSIVDEGAPTKMLKSLSAKA